MSTPVASTQICCGLCHVVFHLENAHIKLLEKTRTAFYCPNGHKRCFRSDETLRNVPAERPAYGTGQDHFGQIDIQPIRVSRRELDQPINFLHLSKRAA